MARYPRVLVGRPRPRSRRPTDVVLLVLTVVTVAVLAFPAPGPTSIDSLVTGLVQSLPGLFGWFWELAYDLLLGWTLVLVALALLARGRKRLLVEELGAGARRGRAGRRTARRDRLGRQPRALSASGSPPVYVAVRLAVATAVVVMASPYLARPLRYVGRAVVGVGALAAIALETAFPIGMVAAFAVGIGSAAIVHLVFGSPAGRLTLDQVADALADLGWRPAGCARRRWSPAGWPSPPPRRRTGARCWSRCTAGTPGTASCWPPPGPRGTGATPPPGPGPPRQVEHEAFVTLLAERAGVAVLPVVAAGMASEQDAAGDRGHRPPPGARPRRGRRRAPRAHLGQPWAAACPGGGASTAGRLPDRGPA